MEATDSSSVAGFKLQAARLRDFLAKAGHDLKHTHSLEAIAAVHGARNWNTLQGLRTQNDPAETWLVLSYGRSALPHATLAETRQVAIGAFLQLANLHISLFPDVAYDVVGVDDDAALEGLYLYASEDKGHALCVSLQRPMWNQAKDSEPLPDLTAWQMPFRQMSLALTRGCAAGHKGPWGGRAAGCIHA